MSPRELIRSHPGTIFYWQWYYGPNGPIYSRRGQEYHSMSQVGARVNRYKQVEVESE